MMAQAAAGLTFLEISIFCEQSHTVITNLKVFIFLHHYRHANTVVCVSLFSTAIVSPHNSKHQKLWRHKSNIMSHQTLDSVLSWPKYFHLPDVSVSPVLVIANNCQLDKVSFEGLAAAENKALVCCCKC